MELLKNNDQFKKDFFHGNLLIVLRGETFRTRIFSENIQIYCIETFIKHVLKPIKETHPDLKIAVHLLVYPHFKNIKLVNIISNYCSCTISNLSRKEDNQTSTFIKCIDLGINKNVDGLLITRVDLAFIQNLNPKNFCKSKILFQWNLLHDNFTKEMADQIHFLGSEILKPIYKESFKNKIDEKWEGTLHNLLRFSLKVFPKYRIGYLNYIEDPNPNRKNSKVEIRGNPMFDLGNPLYLYSRQVGKILFRSNIFYYLFYLFLLTLKKFFNSIKKIILLLKSFLIDLKNKNI